MKTTFIDYSEITDEYYSIITKAPIIEGRNKNRKYPSVIDMVCAFDIETTYLAEIDDSCMYTWQLSVEGQGLLGRQWSEFYELMENLELIAKEREARLVIYVHNLSFEFQFLRSLLEFSPDDVFIVKSRKILKAVYHNLIEFRCAYLLTNMSLDDFTKKMEVEHQKLSGQEFDYSKRRYPWTELTEDEKSYCMHDVYGLVEALHKYFEINNDNLLSVPMTSTGFVRRDAKNAMRTVSRDEIEDMLPNWHIYTLCRDAFRGGNTHANRYYVGHILKDVYSADRSSSYPDVQINCPFPMSCFSEEGQQSVRRLEQLIEKEKAILVRVIFYNIELKDKYWGCPYLSYDKCEGTTGEIVENGRILKSKFLETTLTDIDYRIIESEYKWDKIEIVDLCYASYGPLPKPLKQVTIDYYINKTSLKGVDGQEVFYVKSKNLLNSIFGMTAQNPVKPEIKMYGLEYHTVDTDLKKLLYATRNRQFMPYQWGVWITAWARYRLEEGIRIAGDDFVYCDTDCVKSLKELNWKAYNKERMNDSKASGAYAKDAKGRIHYMGVYETEEKLDRFVTWGAKKYCGELNGKLAVTVSGVVRKHSASELERLGGIEAFRPGLRFVDAGGLEARYQDHDLQVLEIDGHKLYLTSSVSLVPSEYTLGITSKYEKILAEAGLYSENYLDIRLEK